MPILPALALVLAPLTPFATLPVAGPASATFVQSTSSAAPEAGRPVLLPSITSSTSYRLRQTVRLSDVPAGSQHARLWVPVPSDTAWQRVVDLRVVDAPTGWKLEQQDGPRGRMVYVDVAKPSGDVAVTIECVVHRDAVRFPLDPGTGEAALGAIDGGVFARELSTNDPLMEASAEVRAMAAKACEGVTDPRVKVTRLLDAVAASADHYSKDPTKPTCGRGAAQDCLAHGGGCCTDLHSLFIAMARAEGIPARLQFGYRLTPANEAKKDADPGYRCWVEYFLPRSGWVPTDIVVADSGEASARPNAWGTLDDRRVWLWEGRGFMLAPAQTGAAIQTMIVGHAEIDGVAVDPLPASDGTPSKLQRRITFSVIERRDPAARVAVEPTSPKG